MVKITEEEFEKNLKKIREEKDKQETKRARGRRLQERTSYRKKNEKKESFSQQ